MQNTEIDPITAGLLHAAVHDLRGPANRLKLLAQLLGRSGAALDDDARKLLGYVEDSAAAVGEVAEGLRKYVEICARPLHRQRLELGLTLEAAVSAIRSQIASAGAQVHASALPEVYADPFLMEWLIQELLTNAVRFRSPNPLCVEVSAGEGGPSGWFISVLDDGPGIDAAMAERAFRPFKKLSPGPGAGLGLTICRKIVELHEGQLWLEPRNGGADFRFFVSGPSMED